MEKIKYNDEYCGSVAASNNNDNNSVMIEKFNDEKVVKYVNNNHCKGNRAKYRVDRHKYVSDTHRVHSIWTEYFFSLDQLKRCFYHNNYMDAEKFYMRDGRTWVEFNYDYEAEENAILKKAETEEAPATDTKITIDNEPKIHEVLVISAIKDAIKTNSTDEYSVGDGYTISINDEGEIKVSVPNENRTIDYRIGDWATEDQWLFNKEEVIKKIAKNIIEDIYIDPNGYDGVPTFEQSQFAINALMEDDNNEDEYAEVISTESGVWYIESDINIEDYMENGYDKPLPEDVQNWLHEQEIIVCYDSYPYYKDHKVIDHSKRITSPKTYGDIIKPYVDYLAEIDKEAANDSSWECLHTPDCLWVEGFKIEAKLSRLIKNNAFAEIYIGS